MKAMRASWYTCQKHAVLGRDEGGGNVLTQHQPVGPRAVADAPKTRLRKAEPRARGRIRSRCTAWPDGRIGQVSRCQSHRACRRRTGRRRPGSRAGKCRQRTRSKPDPTSREAESMPSMQNSRQEPSRHETGTSCCLDRDGCGGSSHPLRLH